MPRQSRARAPSHHGRRNAARLECLVVASGNVRTVVPTPLRIRRGRRWTRRTERDHVQDSETALHCCSRRPARKKLSIKEGIHDPRVVPNKIRRGDTKGSCNFLGVQALPCEPIHLSEPRLIAEDEFLQFIPHGGTWLPFPACHRSPFCFWSASHVAKSCDSASFAAILREQWVEVTRVLSQSSRPTGILVPDSENAVAVVPASSMSLGGQAASRSEQVW